MKQTTKMGSISQLWQWQMHVKHSLVQSKKNELFSLQFCMSIFDHKNHKLIQKKLIFSSHPIHPPPPVSVPELLLCCIAAGTATTVNESAVCTCTIVDFQLQQLSTVW